jgi:DNA-binding CsgD family transcriptional regulator
MRAAMQPSVPSAAQRIGGEALPPCVVIESANPVADTHLRCALDAARAAGWQPVAGLLAPRGRVVCYGRVASEADAVLALRAAIDGAGLVVIVATSRETSDRLIDDLRRLGPVDHVTADVMPAPAVDPEQRRLLALLAEGLTLGEAASELGLSRRTADRRLRSAKHVLGVARTAEALAKAREAGWFDPAGASG